MPEFSTLKYPVHLALRLKRYTIFAIGAEESKLKKRSGTNIEIG